MMVLNVSRTDFGQSKSGLPERSPVQPTAKDRFRLKHCTPTHMIFNSISSLLLWRREVQLQALAHMARLADNAPKPSVGA